MERLEAHKPNILKLKNLFENLTGFTISKNQDVNKILSLINMLKPIDSGIELLRIGPSGDGVI